MQEFNWVREYNKLLEILNRKETYFSGNKFISVIREFDPYFPDYYQYLEHRKQKQLSTSRKNYFYDILMNFKEDLRKQIIERFYEEAKEMEQKASEEKRDGIDAYRQGYDDGKATRYFPPSDFEDIFGTTTKKAEANSATTESRNAIDKSSMEPKSVQNQETENVSTATLENPVVFISYSWDDEDHKQWILNLSTRLFDNGVQVILDRYELKPGANLLHFMESSIPKADKVLIVFTPNYKLKAEKRQAGVGFEYSILNSELYTQITTNEKFIPILKAGEFAESIPSFMQQFIAVDMRDSAKFEDRFNELLLAIYDKPQLEKPKLGKTPF